MLSLVELERVARVVSKHLVGGRVERWVEPGRGRLAFSIYHRPASPVPSSGPGEARKVVLEIDARSEVAHLGRLERMPKAPGSLPAFSAYLRAHLSRARLESATLRGEDRQLALRFSAREGRYDLLLSIFGRRSNLYLLDAESIVLRALLPLSETRPELALGRPWVDPAGSAPRRGEDRFVGLEGLALLEGISKYYAGELDERSSEDERRSLLAAIKKERKSAARRVARIEAELEEAEEANALQRHGELLKTRLKEISPGATQVTIEDFETGDPVEIRLDPRLSPRENLEAIFKRYQKLLRRLAKAGGQIDAARESLKRLEALEDEVREAERVDAIVERDSVRDLLGRSGKKPGPATTATPRPPERDAPKPPAAFARLPRKLHPRRYRSADGLEIWVGRSDEANDVLTTRLARGKDLFFHLDGAPGSHVILRTEGRDDVPTESVLEACELAVRFSKQKNAGRADVHVVPIKNVKKPKGAKRGLVYVTGGKTIHLRREPARLERILKARIED
jgi:predicted ribosome quality control (RQC) complex YloA/Tae2 family protein